MTHLTATVQFEVMRYASTILYVSDVSSAVAFYENAFGLEPGFTAPGGSYATLGGAGGVLAFASHEMAPDTDRTDAPPAGFEIWIEAEDVPRAYAAALDAGADAVQEPVEKPCGARPWPTCATPTVCWWSWASRCPADPWPFDARKFRT